MDTKLCSSLTLLGFCFLLSLEGALALSARKTSGGDFCKEKESLEYFKTCYVEKSKVGELIIRMKSAVEILNRDDQYLECGDKVKLAEVDPGSIQFCTKDRIMQVQRDLTDVVGRLLELAVRLEEPAETEVVCLKQQALDLVDKLAALRVFYGPSPCDSSSIVIYPFEPLIQHFENSLNRKFAQFQATRPAWPARNFTSGTGRPGIAEMLKPENTFQQLVEMARLNPPAMSKAVPRIVALRYNQQNSTFEKLLEFSEGLPTIETRINGIAAIYDEMTRYNRNPDSSKLMKLAGSVQRFEEFAAKSPSSVGESAKSKLADLVKDRELSQLILLLSQSFLELTETASSNPTLMSFALPEIICQRYNDSDFQFEALVNFVKGLPTTENKIIGFAALHNEMNRQNRNPDSPKLMKLAGAVQCLHKLAEITTSLVDESARKTLADLVTYPDLNPDSNPMVSMFSPQKSLLELSEWARPNPSLMSTALPEIICQRYNTSDSHFDALLKFVEGLPTIENKIHGFAAIYDEMHRYNRHPDSSKLMKLAGSVLRLRFSSACSTSLLGEGERSQLAALFEDPELSQFFSMHIRDKSFSELNEMARSNPSAMSLTLPEIISQRYNASDFQFDALLKFVEGLPTTENKIIGFFEVHNEMHRHDRTLNLTQLLKLTKKVKSLNEDDRDRTAPASTVVAEAATALKWTNLIRELSPLMLVGEKARCQVTNVAYGAQLTVFDHGFPYSAYVDQDQRLKSKFQFYPAIQNDKLVFCIQFLDGPLFVSDTNKNTHSENTKYQTKPSESYVLWDRSRNLPSNAEIDWKLVSVPNKANQFRILSAKSDAFMFAHKSATGILDYRRVLLGKKSYSDHDHIPNADRWTLVDCEPLRISISCFRRSST